MPNSNWRPHKKKKKTRQQHGVAHEKREVFVRVCVCTSRLASRTLGTMWGRQRPSISITLSSLSAIRDTWQNNTMLKHTHTVYKVQETRDSPLFLNQLFFFSLRGSSSTPPFLKKKKTMSWTQLMWSWWRSISFCFSCKVYINTLLLIFHHFSSHNGSKNVPQTLTHMALKV